MCDLHGELVAMEKWFCLLATMHGMKHCGYFCDYQQRSPMKAFLLLFAFAYILFPAVGQDHNFKAAEDAFDEENFREAIDFYTTALEADGPHSNFYVYYKRAYAYFSLTEYAPAQADLLRSMKIDKHENSHDWIKGYSLWLSARIHSKLNDQKMALKLLKKATRYDDSSLLYSTLGLKQYEFNRLKDALESLNRALDENPKNAYAYSNRSLVYLKQNEFEKAREDIRKSIELDPSNPYAFKHSALIFLSLNETEHACNDLYKAVELGYAKFSSGTEHNSREVDQLIEQHCWETAPE